MGCIPANTVEIRRSRYSRREEGEDYWFLEDGWIDCISGTGNWKS